MTTSKETWIKELRDICAMHPDATQVVINLDTFDRLSKRWVEMNEQVAQLTLSRASDNHHFGKILEEAIETAQSRLMGHFFRARRDAHLTVKEAKAKLPQPRNAAEKAHFDALIVAGQAEYEPSEPVANQYEEDEKWLHGQDKLLGRPAGYRDHVPNTAAEAVLRGKRLFK